MKEAQVNYTDEGSAMLLYPVKLSVIIEGKIKTFHDKNRFKGICDD